MQIDGQQPIHARARNHVGHQLSGDGNARRARPPILPRITEVRHHRRDALRRSPPAGVRHHQQFHQMVVRRRTRGLHDEHIAAANVLHQFGVDLAVAEPADVRAPQRHVQVTGDLLCQRRVRVTREHRDG